MSFRQFPATDSLGQSRVIIEFKPEPGTDAARAPQARYELDDGRVLERHGQQFVTAEGDVRLSIG